MTRIKTWKLARLERLVDDRVSIRSASIDQVQSTGTENMWGMWSFSCEECGRRKEEKRSSVAYGLHCLVPAVSHTLNSSSRINPYKCI